MRSAVSRGWASARLRVAVTALTAAVTLLALAGCTAGAPPPKVATQRVVPSGTPVDPALFGTHVGGIASGNQPLPPHAGAIRLWDAGVAWRQLEPAPGEVNWRAMDEAVSQARSTGATEIVWV